MPTAEENIDAKRTSPCHERFMTSRLSGAMIQYRYTTHKPTSTRSARARNVPGSVVVGSTDRRGGGAVTTAGGGYRRANDLVAVAVLQVV
jgi:hypothetical protein